MRDREIVQALLLSAVRGLIAVLNAVAVEGGDTETHDEGPDCWCAPELWALCPDCYAESEFCTNCGGYGMTNVGREDYDEADAEGLAVPIHRSFVGVDV